MRKRFVLRATTYEPLDLRTCVGRADLAQPPLPSLHHYHYVTPRKDIDVSVLLRVLTPSSSPIFLNCQPLTRRAS